MKTEIKIFKNDTMKNCIKKALDEGYTILTLNEVLKFKKEGKIDKNKYFDSRTFGYIKNNKFVVKDLTKKELMDYVTDKWKFGRPLAFGNFYYDVVGVNYLNFGRFVGVKKVK